MLMRPRPAVWMLRLAVIALLLAILSACAAKSVEKQVTQPASGVTEAPAAAATIAASESLGQPTEAAQKTVTQEIQRTQAPAGTAVATQTPTREPTLEYMHAVATPTAEVRTVELEWPTRLRLGDSDTVRLALIPSEEGYTLTTEFPEHTTLTQTVRVQRPEGYGLYAVASLVGVGFELSPSGEQERQLPTGETVTWRWSITPRSSGQQRISITLLLRWRPLPGTEGVLRESSIFSRSLTVNAISFFGLTRGQAMTGGLFGLVFGGAVSLLALAYPSRSPRPRLKTQAPNQQLAIESRPGIEVHPNDMVLMRALFNRYGRISIEGEFLSGYSGARTYLVVPIRPDGRADAYTIVKIGDRSTIQREYENYEAFVKDTLPPITARIQHAPVVLPARRAGRGNAPRAAVQYTFIGAPGQTPTSLRQALLADPNPALLEKLFETFGPNWWMQRHPHSFRLAQEYDCLLPAHLVIRPEAGRGGLTPGKLVNGRLPPTRVSLAVGDRVLLRGFTHLERRADGKSLSLHGAAAAGHPILRVRWLGLGDPNNATGRVVATRATLLAELTANLNLLGQPDPLTRLSALLEERLSGTRSTIHGDLNLENILVGPGGFGPQGFVWLIDFAQTRDGHPLYDFAHLEAEIIAHVIAPQISDPAEYLRLLQDPEQARQNPFYALRFTVQSIAARCLFNPSQPREYDLALYLACLGALKYNNLETHARHLLYLTAADIGQRL